MQESRAPERGVYKWLNGREAKSVLGFRYRLGKWYSVSGKLAFCRNGIHLARVEHLSAWIAQDLYVAEYEGECLDAKDMLVASKARIVERLRGWNRRAARLAAADFAEAVLYLFERVEPGDERPRRAIALARGCARGEAPARRTAAAALQAREAALELAARPSWDSSTEAAEAAARAASYAALWAASASSSLSSSCRWQATVQAATKAARASVIAAAKEVIADGERDFAHVESVCLEMRRRQGEIVLAYAEGRRR